MAEATLAMLSPDSRAFDWHDQAACAGEDHDRFFTDQCADIAWAKAICRRCDVRAVCLAAELARPMSHQAGVFGGLTANERRRRLGATG